MTIYIAKAKREDGDKTYWDDVGIKVMVRDDKVSIFDARTQTWYNCFEPRPRDDKPQHNSGGRGSRDFNDDIPFAKVTNRYV